LQLHVPAPNKRGRPRTHDTREILNAIFYILKSGCPWRLLPKDFPPWETVYWWFGRWRMDGTFERLNAALSERVRSRLGRNPLPSGGYRRLPVLQEHRSRRRTERIRRQQEGSRQKAPPLGGHRGVGPQGQGAQREGARPGRTEAPTEVGAEWAQSAFLTCGWTQATRAEAEGGKRR
jgi:transposase